MSHLALMLGLTGAAKWPLPPRKVILVVLYNIRTVVQKVQRTLSKSLKSYLKTHEYPISFISSPYIFLCLRYPDLTLFS